MKAQVILSRWERVAPMLRSNNLAAAKRRRTLRVKTVTLWLAMLYCAEGRLSVGELAVKLDMTFQTARALLRFLADNGLVVIGGFCRRAGRPRKLYDPTPRLYDVLGVQPADKQHASVTAP